jgi:hemin uptake protein HemP
LKQGSRVERCSIYSAETALKARMSRKTNTSVPPSHGAKPEAEVQGDSSKGAENHSSSVRYRVDELMQGGREAILQHRGQDYRLRITATGKLILTK